MKYYNQEMPEVHPTGCVAMTWKDAEEMEKLNNENGWGFSDSDLLRLTADHMEAYLNHMEATDNAEILKHVAIMEKIEWRLTDANFHKLCGALNEHKYKTALNAIAEDLMIEEDD